MDFGTPPPKTTTQSTTSNTTFSLSPQGENDSYKDLQLNFDKRTKSTTAENPATIKVTTEEVPLASSGLNFGNTTQGFNSKLNNLKSPTTICVSVGGPINTLEAVINQVGEAVDKIAASLVVTVPTEVNIPTVSIAAMAIPMLPKIDLSAEQVLQQISSECAAILLNKLDDLDPLLRLQALINKLQELCGSLAVDQMRAVIDKIEQTKVQLLYNMIDKITDPAAKIAKLVDLANDAISSGTYSFLQNISSLMNTLVYNNLMQIIQTLDPQTAITNLTALLQQQVQLKNFAQVRQILGIMNMVKNGFNQAVNIGSLALDLPELTIDQLQLQIDNLLNLNNFDEINKLISAFETAEDLAIQAIKNMDPAAALARGQQMMQDALQKMDIAKYSRILTELSANLCNQAANLIPSPNAALSGAGSAIPSFLTKP